MSKPSDSELKLIRHLWTAGRLPGEIKQLEALIKKLDRAEKREPPQARP